MWLLDFIILSFGHCQWVSELLIVSDLISERWPSLYFKIYLHCVVFSLTVSLWKRQQQFLNFFKQFSLTVFSVCRELR